MTNAEKFEEVFGIKIDEDDPRDICQSIDHRICEEHNCCPDCPSHNFWDQEYKEVGKMNNIINEAFLRANSINAIWGLAMLSGHKIEAEELERAQIMIMKLIDYIEKEKTK